MEEGDRGGILCRKGRHGLVEPSGVQAHVVTDFGENAAARETALPDFAEPRLRESFEGIESMDCAIDALGEIID